MLGMSRTAVQFIFQEFEQEVGKRLRRVQRVSEVERDFMEQVVPATRKPILANQGASE